MHVRNILVFSHLRWNFVYQRPQHLLARLSRGRRIFFVEEPVRGESEHWQRSEVEDGRVLVCTPVTPVAQPGFQGAQIPTLRRLLRQLIEKENLCDAAHWFYTPMALPIVEGLPAQLTIYDCMDELSAFAGAPPELVRLEADLFRRADLVFTGGRSLFEAKKKKHPNVHCFPSSVDVNHFARAADPRRDHREQSSLPHPRLGYFGVIDERMDLGLIRELAASHPEWHIALVGPVVKIDPSSVPRASNIHCFGQRPYSELPDFLAGWDVALLPFALNDATRFISPTKTLEYMAGGKAIVSTRIRDVAESYSDVVRIADSPSEFVARCEEALGEPEPALRQRSGRVREILNRTSWDSTAAEMNELIDRAAARKKSRAVAASSRDVVIGAGPTGLSAAYHLGSGAVLLERESTVGGWCRSIEVNGFTFDYAGHIMFSNEPYVHEMYRMLLGENVHWQDREAWVYSKGVYTRYPFQGALYGLPPDVIKECVVGAIEARFGAVTNNGASHRNGKTNGHAYNGSPGCSIQNNGDCCADGIPELNAHLEKVAHTPAPENFEDFIYRVWGRGIAKHFAIPYNRKLWAVPLREMETSWLGGRVPLPDLEEMIEGALIPKPRPMGPNARFGYPLRGGFQSLMNGFLPRLKCELRLNADVAQVSPRRREVLLGDGSAVRYENLISTMPLPALIRAIGSEAPPEVHSAARGLRHTSVRCVHIGVGRSDITDKHWIYYPEDTVFHRIFVQGNASPHCNPPGGFGFTCEITYGPNKPLARDGEELIRLCVEDARRVGFIRADDPVVATAMVDLPCAYVVYDHQRKQRVEKVREWLASVGIILAGRYAEWEYYNSDHAFIAGKKAAEQALQSANRAARQSTRTEPKPQPLAFGAPGWITRTQPRAPESR